MEKWDLWLLCGFTIVLLQFAVTSTAARAVWGEPKYKCVERPKLIYPCTCLKGSDDGLFIDCENTNLATLSVALQNIAVLNMPVEHLTIRKGHFARLYGPMFAKIPARQLTIEDTPIEVIEDYAFYGVNKTLELLQLLRSNLSTITPLSLGILGKVTQLVIDGHMLEKLEKNLFEAQEISNRVEIVRIVNGPLSDIPIEAFQPLRKLKTLDLHGNQLESLKRNQFKNLRSVEVLDISFNKITKLEAQHIGDLSKLGWLNVSNNALNELSRGTFARNSVLKVLNMSFNKITRLDVNSFRGMRFLRRLFLSDNRISEIGRGTFGSVAKIGTIDLARNALRKVEFQMFSQLNYVELLDMAENNINLVEKNSFKDIYQAVINISHNALELIEPNAFENCVNITVLDLSFNRLTNFSKGSFDTNTFATVFQLSHNMLTNLAQIPLQNMTGIKILNASYNNIAQIPKNCFPKLYEMHTIDVSHNNISVIANGVFQTLFSLRNLNLSHNALQEVKSSMFGTLPTLLALDLSQNNLSLVVRGSLAKLTSLRALQLDNNYLEKLFQIPISLNELYMKGNRIEAIPAGTWPVMNALISLDLSDNLIGDSLHADSFTGLLVLQRLWLNNNGITRPPLECLARMTTLQYLHLEYNNITELEKSAFGKLPVLFELNLHNNNIGEVGKRAFEGLLQLLTLNLSANALSGIANDAFIGLPSLRRLDLAHNQLTKLDNKTNGVLDDLLSLEDLNLSHNRISFVTKKTFPSHQYIPYNLKYLDLSFNQMPVLTYDITFGTKKLLHLNLSHNHINEIRKGVVGNFTSLQSLDLSHNELSNLLAEEHVFDMPKNLTQLYLRNNSIYGLPFKNFIKEPKFEVLDLRDNSLSEFPLPLVWNLRNATNVLFAGNPLHCSCAVRPLKHYTLELTDLSDDLLNVVCSSPLHVEGENLVNVNDEKLQCIAEERQMYAGEAFNELTDVRFRDIKIVDSNRNVSVRWFVTSARDIADFTAYVRDVRNSIVHQAVLGYNKRSAKIPIDALRVNETDLTALEICIVSMDSMGNTGRWFAGQCQKLPQAKSNRRFFFGPSSAADFRAGPHLFVCVVFAFVIYFC